MTPEKNGAEKPDMIPTALPREYLPGEDAASP
jgi:hypothetical protein